MKLTELKGIGDKTEELFAKLGVTSAEDLLDFFPRDYERFEEPIRAARIGYKTFAALRGVFCGQPVSRKAGRLVITTAELRDDFGGRVRTVWFNSPYIKASLPIGKEIVARGRISRRMGLLQLEQPRIYTAEEYRLRTESLQPVYQLTKGLTNAQVAKAVRAALSSPAFESCRERDILPESIREKYGLCPADEMIRQAHFPENEEKLESALRRAAFEEIFLFILQMRKNEDIFRRKSEYVICRSPLTENFIESLPYELTASQRKVLSEIGRDMASKKVMNRLIQGDVGSGKTILALCACMDAAFSGYQAALMAPTEVLCAQHFEKTRRLFKERGVSLRVGMLTGSMTALEKKAVSGALSDGRIDIVIGTHALFQENVKYKNLALVITDEQHRFGINQRKELASKGMNPHMLVMSATPIPRTLALIVYGNMDVSALRALPSGRKPIKNAVIDDSYKEKAYRLIEREVRAGHQAIIICPLIEISEGSRAQNVTDYTEMIRDIFPEDISIGMLHGKMKSAEKDEIMEKFASGRIQILVATTVIEVGVDVPNATVMMIENSDRFGLAALHQLRGRVGRSELQSYCIFVCESGSQKAAERLEILKKSNDGFEIAAKDLEMRGPGEFLGVKQSGELSFRHFDLYRDAAVATEAKEAADALANGNIPILPSEEAALREAAESDEARIIL